VSAAREPSSRDVLRTRDLPDNVLYVLLSRFGLLGVSISQSESIPGSYWGESEAGLIGETVYWRSDTPLHSVLHEASHAVCMDGQRRNGLDRDAGGDFDEENAVCYLQILLSHELPQVGRARMWRDMDAWGYTFRLGSAQAWFEQDAADARRWLIDHRLIDDDGNVTWRKRESG
jgi:hypothetical protein